MGKRTRQPLIHRWMVCIWTYSFASVLTLSSHRFVFATLLSVYNKWMFSPDRYGFPSPLFVTTTHMWVQFSLAALLRYTLPGHFRPDHNPNREDYM